MWKVSMLREKAAPIYQHHIHTPNQKNRIQSQDRPPHQHYPSTFHPPTTQQMSTTHPLLELLHRHILRRCEWDPLGFPIQTGTTSKDGLVRSVEGEVGGGHCSGHGGGVWRGRGHTGRGLILFWSGVKEAVLELLSERYCEYCGEGVLAEEQVKYRLRPLKVTCSLATQIGPRSR